APSTRRTAATRPASAGRAAEAGTTPRRGSAATACACCPTVTRRTPAAPDRRPTRDSRAASRPGRGQATVDGWAGAFAPRGRRGASPRLAQATAGVVGRPRLLPPGGGAEESEWQRKGPHVGAAGRQGLESRRGGEFRIEDPRRGRL